MNDPTLVRNLPDWYLIKARDLPWRKHRDPYLIWISEVMLQQTQVATVIPFYERFLALFPNLKTLAEAPQADVLTAWSGLGYYSRAKNLQRGAQYLLSEHQGKFPRDRELLLKTPGIGPYTAGAILSIAFDLKVPLVDGNVQRVFARFYGIDTPLESKSTQLFFWSKAQATVELCVSPRIFNQALMELGATVCTKAKPQCHQCPIAKGCVAKKTHRQAELPLKKKRRASIDLFWQSLIFEFDGALFLKKNSDDEWWSHMWDFPRLESEQLEDLAVRFKQLEKKVTHLHAVETLDFQKHTVTHHRIQVAPILFQLTKKLVPEGWKGRWVRPAEMEKLPVSALVKKVMRSYGERRPQLSFDMLE